MITPPMPTFNLLTNANANNQLTNGNQIGAKDKQLSASLKEMEAKLYALGISDASVEVIKTTVKGVPTITVLFKGGAAFANLAKAASALKGLGPIGVALNFYVDMRKTANNDETIFKGVVNTTVGVVGLFVPEIGIVYMILDHYGAFDGAPNNLPDYQPELCPRVSTKVIIPNYTH
ncbi:MAG: hypothetical protein WC542_03930 [Paludibacter sp.]